MRYILSDIYNQKRFNKRINVYRYLIHDIINLKIMSFKLFNIIQLNR